MFFKYSILPSKDLSILQKDETFLLYNEPMKDNIDSFTQWVAIKSTMQHISSHSIDKRSK